MIASTTQTLHELCKFFGKKKTGWNSLQDFGSAYKICQNLVRILLSMASSSFVQVYFKVYFLMSECDKSEK